MKKTLKIQKYSLKQKIKRNNHKMRDIQQWLDENDYIINKHTLGEYTDESPKWIDYLANRKEKLTNFNELENQNVTLQEEVNQINAQIQEIIKNEEQENDTDAGRDNSGN